MVFGDTTRLSVMAIDAEDHELSYQWQVIHSPDGANPMLEPGQNPQVIFDAAGSSTAHASMTRSGEAPQTPSRFRSSHCDRRRAMLWVGWFGFNASAAAADGSAGMAMLVTHFRSYRKLGLDVH